MKVPESKRKQWKQNREHCDIQLIHEETGISRSTISGILNGKGANPETIEAIDKFYKRKQRLAR